MSTKQSHKSKKSPRRLTEDDYKNPNPFMLSGRSQCDVIMSCAHCGSQAEFARPDELSTEELLDVANQLIRIGTREVTLIGGEAYLRSDVYTLVEAL